MPRIQPFLGFLRPALAPRCAAYRPTSSFSTVSKLRSDGSAKPTFTANTTSATSASNVEDSQTPSSQTAQTPLSPEEASRTADLAAAEAATEADSAQSPTPKPILPSDHTNTISSEPSNTVIPKKELASRKPNPKAERKTNNAGATAIRKAPENISNVQVLPIGRAKKLKLEAKAAKEAKILKKLSAAQTGNGKVAPTSDASSQLSPARYHVARSRSDNIPVYSDYKRGGNLHQTTVRKITGDLQALRDELKLYLDKQDKDIRVNVLTKHVVVKGHHVPEVIEYLKARGM